MRVIFMCGASGSGKTTYARRLEQQGMTRLSFDVEMWRRGITAVPLAADVRAAVEDDLRAQLVSCLTRGEDVVLDFSFWSQRMRDEWREVVRPFGVEPETIYLPIDRRTALERLRRRRGAHADDYVIPEDLAASYVDHFEPPTADEGPLRVITGSDA